MASVMVAVLFLRMVSHIDSRLFKKKKTDND